MLGGSSLWGFGARDDETIPSLVARKLDERGWRVESGTWPRSAMSARRKLIALFRELQAGYRPDLVIFYDGVNDTTSALLEGEAGLTTNEVNRRQEFNLLQSPARLAAALIAKLVKDSGSYRFAQAVRRRSSGDANSSRPSPTDEIAASSPPRSSAATRPTSRSSRSWAEASVSRPLFYWQPVVFDKPVLVPFEREEAGKFAWAEAIFREVYGKFATRPSCESTRRFTT